MEISPAIAIGLSLGFGLITVFLLKLAMSARKAKSRLGVDALVGSPASAMEALNPDGHVLVEGEIWLAVASEPVSAGAQLQVTGSEQYVLQVAPVKARQQAAHAVSG
jgi:membrane-bound serine protease (ClpP class)